ncbi:hypothetical protein H6F94_13085 [Leptolyngbya sp. FACHB-261]|nr:hypothetical protein [Leptolyngbya sp. FACHB-261]
MDKLPAQASLQPLTQRHLLSYEQTYTCPVCRHGQIQGLVLTDAFACNFCRHIFTANLSDNVLRVEDSSQPLQWRWTGRGWQSVQHDDVNLTLVIWTVGVALVLLPPTLVWMAYHTFPPAAGSALSFFPILWTVLTFLTHLSLVVWLLAEHYQLPLYISNRIRLRTLFSRRDPSRR